MTLLARLRRPTLWLLPACLALLTGCAGVKVSSIQPSDYLAERRADVLTSGHLSPATRESLRVMGSEAKPCLADAAACRTALRSSAGLSDEQRLSALAELWAKEAMDQERTQPAQSMAAWLEAARYAWAYLFFTDRSPAARAQQWQPPAGASDAAASIDFSHAIRQGIPPLSLP